jgi:hypothetical protein
MKSWSKHSGLVLTDEQFTVQTDGKYFKCSCGCNVFKKVVDPRSQGFHVDEVYACNVCPATYTSDPEE